MKPFACLLALLALNGTAYAAEDSAEQPDFTTPHLDLKAFKPRPDTDGWVHFIGLSYKGAMSGALPHGQGLCRESKADPTPEPCTFRNGQRVDQAFLARTGASIQQAAAWDRQWKAEMAEAERQNREDERRRDEQMAAAFMGAANTFNSEMQKSNEEYEAQQAAIREAAARGRAQYEAQQAREAEARAAQQQAYTHSSSDPAPTIPRTGSKPPAAKPSTGGTGSWEKAGTPRAGTQVASASSTPKESSPKSKLLETPEAIFVCTIPGADGRFRCDSPVTAGLSGGPKSGIASDRTPEAMAASKTASCPELRRLESQTHFVWGCGFGATNNSAQMDRSAGVDVHGRRTYYCHPKETGCRRTSPQ